MESVIFGPKKSTRQFFDPGITFQPEKSRKSHGKCHFPKGKNMQDIFCSRDQFSTWKSSRNQMESVNCRHNVFNKTFFRSGDHFSTWKSRPNKKESVIFRHKKNTRLFVCSRDHFSTWKNRRNHMESVNFRQQIFQNTFFRSRDHF